MPHGSNAGRCGPYTSPIPAPGSVWTREGARIALSRDGEGGAAAAALPVHAAPTLPSPPRPAPPAVRAVSAVKQYKYLGDVSSNDQSYAAARVTFAHRLANKLKQILGRLFAFNRVTLKLRVATKMQLLGTLMLGATSYLLAVHRLTVTELERAEAPIRRALMEILGIPARGAMAVVAMMEAPAVVPFTTLSLTHRMRLLCTLHGTPHFAASPPASLVQRATGAYHAPRGLGGALLPADRALGYAPIPDVGALIAVAGFTFPRDTLTELSELVRPLAADRFVGVPNVDWRPPTTARGIIPAIHRLRVTACFHQLGNKHLMHWAQRRVWPPVGASQAGAGAQPSRAALSTRPASASMLMLPHRTSSRNDPDPRPALLGRPPPDQQGHISALYYSTSHSLPSDAGPFGRSPVTCVSWAGPGGGGRNLALCQLSTEVVAPVARARLGNYCFQLYPWARHSDSIMPLADCERSAVCGACRKEAPVGKLMLCNGVCGRALHWSARCARAPGAGGISEFRAAPRATRPPNAAAAQQGGGSGRGGGRRGAAGALPAPRRRPALPPLPLPGAGPMPKRWFCSRDCKAFHDSAVAADAASRAEHAETSDVTGRGCQLCAAAASEGGAERRANADTEDLWHLLFICEHPAMLAIRGDMRLSAISHCVALAESLLAAVERALEWHPGDALAGAAARAAVDDLRRVAQGLRDADAGLDAHCLYRLMMALPFSANAIPPPEALPPPMPPPSPPPPLPTTPLPLSPPPTGRYRGGESVQVRRGRPPVREPPRGEGTARRRRSVPTSPPRRGAVPPPPAAPSPVDHYAASRALGRVYDLVRLPNAVLRPTANRAVSWASRWICTIAAARRAVLFPVPVPAAAAPARAMRSSIRPARPPPVTAATRPPMAPSRPGGAAVPRAPSDHRTDPCADAGSAAAAPRRRGAASADCVPPYAASGGVPLLDNPLPGAPGPPTEPSRAPA